MGYSALFIKSILVLFYFLIAFTVSAQQDTLKKEKKITYTALPIAFYLPETGFAFGGMGSVAFRFKGEPKNSRPSQIILGTAYTLKKQLLIYSPYQFYFKNEKNRILGEAGYYRYFFNFYGIGPNSRKEHKEIYRVNFPRFYNRYIRNIKGAHFGGIGFKFDYFDIVEIAENGIINQNELIGREGGSMWMTSLSYIFDNRDHLFFPTKGFFIDFNIDTSIDGFISPHTFSKSTLDARGYHAVGKKMVLAHQFYLSYATNTTPFYYLPYVSASPGLARGFPDRRYTDYFIGHWQSELRYPIFKRFNGTVFTGLSHIGDDPTNNAFKISGGLGLRYELNKKEKTRIRLDVGFNTEGFNFYLTFNEAF